MDEPQLSLAELREHWHLDLVLAYVGGCLPNIAAGDPQSILKAARERGLNLDPFKRSRILPRVQAVLAMVQSFGPARLVDLGTGRGRLLWQLLDSLPDLEIVTVDRSTEHVGRIEAMRRGGIERVHGLEADVEQVPLPDDSADGVTALEVLEHTNRPDLIAREAVRLARRFLIISVPSVPDTDPEHIHLFDSSSLERLLLGTGARRVTITQVPGHFIALADTRPA